MSCASFFCMGPSDPAHPTPEEEVVKSNGKKQRPAGQLDAIDKTRSIDPDGFDPNGDPVSPARTVTSLLDVDDERVDQGEREETGSNSSTGTSSNKRGDPAESVHRPNGQVSPGRNSTVVARALFASDVANNPKSKEEYSVLRKMTRENKKVAELMEENIRKDFRISSLEASLHANARNPQVWDTVLEEQIADAKEKASTRESDLLNRISNLEAKVKCLEMEMEVKVKLADKTQQEHEKKVMAMNLTNNRQQEEFQRRLENSEQQKASILDTLTQRMAEADQQRSDLIETLGERATELAVTQGRVQELENEIRLRDLMKEAGIDDDDADEDDTLNSKLTSKQNGSPDEDDSDDKQQDAATVAESVMTQDAVASVSEFQEGSSAAEKKNSSVISPSAVDEEPTETEDEPKSMTSKSQVPSNEDIDRQSRLNEALARLTKEAQKVGVKMDVDTDDGASPMDDLIESSRSDRDESGKDQAVAE